MGLARPTGRFVEHMLGPAGWPDTDEDALYDRAQQYTQVLHHLTDVLDASQHQQAEIVEGGVWSGGAATAANGRLTTHIDDLVALQHGIAAVVTWQQHTATTITQAKNTINDTVESAQRQITAITTDSALSKPDQKAAIRRVVKTTLTANVDAVTGAAAQIRASQPWTPPDDALQHLLDQRVPPPDPIPDLAPSDHSTPETSVLLGSVAAAAGSQSPGRAPSASPTPALRGGALPSAPWAPPGDLTPPGVAAASGQRRDPAPMQDATVPSGGPTMPLTAPAAPAGQGTAPGSAAAQTASAAESPAATAGQGMGMAPASVRYPVAPKKPGSPHSDPGDNSSPAGDQSSVAPPAGAGMPFLPMAPSASSGPGAAAGQTTAGQAPTVRPAATAPPGPGGRTGPAQRPGPPEEHHPGHAGAAMAAIPVSAARAMRDAITDAATADASRRTGPDPLQIARHIAAALNAPDGRGRGDMGFFWLTGVTTDGTIVVANSYGLAYIPESVQLPDQVILASADDAIPAAQRARWATYPMVALEDWAAYRQKPLRAVIATAAQLAGSDSGAATVVLAPDDIPEHGAMVGRSRLGVVDPHAAERLAATPDSGLARLLAPTRNATGPANPLHMLWRDVMTPLARSATSRQGEHLKAFHTYAAAARESCLMQARTPASPGTNTDAVRTAIADWLYWKHIARLLDAAMTPVSQGSAR